MRRRRQLLPRRFIVCPLEALLFTCFHYAVIVYERTLRHFRA